MRATNSVPGVRCPRCGGTIVYNGNYYCQDWDEGGDCRWAMGERETAFTRRVKRSYMQQRRREATAAGDQTTVDRMNLYLKGLS